MAPTERVAYQPGIVELSCHTLPVATVEASVLKSSTSGVLSAVMLPPVVSASDRPECELLMATPIARAIRNAAERTRAERPGLEARPPIWLILDMVIPSLHFIKSRRA